jgi:glycyl-tRNA synthetase beta chain
VAELFIELFSEEIPARMQRGAAAELERAVTAALGAIAPAGVRTWFGPRRIALRADVVPEVAASSSIERGPRSSAPEQALTGFLRKHGRPLRRITCLLDGTVVPFDLREGADDGHGLAGGNLTEGHRVHAPDAITVLGAADWQDKLTAARVVVDVEDRKRIIADRIDGLAAEKALTVVDDPGLLDEVAGLVEWPVPHLGRIAEEHMDLPPEVMQVSMRVNQRYFALRTADGQAAPQAAPWFAFVANVEADDHGAAIIAGNERVLRARFADARHFWDLDRKARLETRVPALDAVTFQAKLGTQGERVRRLKALARTIAVRTGAELPGRIGSELEPAPMAVRAAELAKADLVTGMVGEFPELQGVMGRDYALHDGEPAEVADAIRDH